MTANDHDLLRQFTTAHSQDAFTLLVRRHLDLVYSVALRQVRSPQLAEEVAQSVFADLSRQAHRLKAGTILTAWLYQVARRTAVDVVRRESRRQVRERLAMEMADMNTTSDWTAIESLLDEAMDALDETDRAAILLRFFENKSLREVGLAIGASDDAAQKRVARAVERLRGFFTQRGVAIGAGGLAMAISSNAVHAAPAGMVLAISSAIAAGAVAAKGSLSLLQSIFMSKLKVGVLGTVLALSAVTSLVIEQNSQARIRGADEALRRQAGALDDLKSENERLSRLAADSNHPSMNTLAELQRLRGEVAALRPGTNQLAALREQERQLQASARAIRQEQNSTNSQQTVRSKQLEAKIRSCMEWALAAIEYSQEHQDRFPTNLTQAAAFLRKSGQTPDDPVLEADNFEIVYQGTRSALQKYAYPDEILLIREKSAWINTDGKSVKAYSFIHGSGRSISLVDGNYDAWEAQHIVSDSSASP